MDDVRKMTNVELVEKLIGSWAVSAVDVGPIPALKTRQRASEAHTAFKAELLRRLDAPAGRFVELLEQAKKAISAVGHKTTCGFNRCTCGSVETFKIESSEFWRKIRALASRVPASLSSGSNYVADDEVYPTRVEFANGRVVAIKHEDGRVFLGIGMLAVPQEDNSDVPSCHVCGAPMGPMGADGWCCYTCGATTGCTDPQEQERKPNEP